MRIELSEQSINALAQVLSGGAAGDVGGAGIYRRGWELENLFKPFNASFTLEGHSRLTATIAAITNVAMWSRDDDDDRMERLLAKSCDPRDYINAEGRLAEAMHYLNQYLLFDGLKLVRDGLKTKVVELRAQATVVGAFSAVAEALDLDTVGRDLDRALASAESDPEDAVTAACSVVESVCRSILIESDLGLPAKQDISGLYRAVREPLGLSPTKEGVPDLIAEDVRSTLSGLVTAVQSIGALRTHGGDAHGRERGFRRIDARIARLAIHSASAVCLFLIETWQLRFPDKALRKR